MTNNGSESSGTIHRFAIRQLKRTGRDPTLTNGNLDFGADINSNFTTSNGNDVVTSGSNWRSIRVVEAGSGSGYWEYKFSLTCKCWLVAMALVRRLFLNEPDCCIIHMQQLVLVDQQGSGDVSNVSYGDSFTAGDTLGGGCRCW